MIGRFIFICNPLFLRFANECAVELQNNPKEKTLYSYGTMGNVEIRMFAKRLKNSIRVQQVKP